MKISNIIILNQSKDMLEMVGYLECHVVLLSVFQSKTDKYVKYDVIGKCPPRMCAG